MMNRPFEKRPLPEHGPDLPQVIPVLLADCEAELEVLKSLSPLSLEDLNRLPRGAAEQLQAEYLKAGRYSQEFLDRRLDLAGFIRRLLRLRTAWLRELRFAPTQGLAGEALAERKQKMAWWNAGMAQERVEQFQNMEYPLRELKPAHIVSLRCSSGCAPDNLADALSQGIGIRDL